MDDDDRVRQLLGEIRDAQREQLAEYQRVTQRSLELQERAVTRQEQAVFLYKGIVALGAVLVMALLGLLVFLLLRWSHELFR